MGSEDTGLPLQLPVIDFSNKNLKPGTVLWDSVRSDVRKALEDYGCFEASFHRIPLEVRIAIFQCLEELFDLPLETKQRNLSQRPYHGYIRQDPTVSLYESMGIDDADIADKIEAFTEMLWPQGNKTFSETFRSLSEELSELDLTIRRMIMESFGLDKYIDEHLNSTYNVLRVMKYQGPDTEEAKVGLKSHTDKNMVTILHQNDVEGLEIQTKDERWIKVKPAQDSFIVMIGDSLHALLNGRLHAPCHRVMMTGKETRYSVGLFSVPKQGHVIYAAEELVDEEHPRMFKPLNHEQFIQFCISEAGRRAQSPLMSYCAL